MSDDGQSAINSPEVALASGATPPDIKDPRVALSLLEADQVVAAKQRMRFGRRNLSPGVRVMLWGLRIYVGIMLVLVLVSVIRTIHLAH
jgi:hypothetical protein